MVSLFRDFEEGTRQVGIVADIGGTNARFQLITPDGIVGEKAYSCAKFDSL